MWIFFLSEKWTTSTYSAVHEDVDEWNCNDCDYQANNSTSLINHLKHTGHQPSEGNVKSVSNIWKCKNCEEDFKNYPSLMKHRKYKHNQNKVCRYFVDNNCNFSAEICWYQHTTVSQQEVHKNKFSCKYCEKEFTNLGQMMLHKKKRAWPNCSVQKLYQ